MSERMRNYDVPPKAVTYEFLRARHRLTSRQADVTRLLCIRRTNREIAEELGISVHTVRRHVEVVLMKLHVHRRLDVTGRLTSDKPAAS